MNHRGLCEEQSAGLEPIDFSLGKPTTTVIPKTSQMRC